ncbi:hypothetical protein [Lewinella sp. IMCC34183]|uniref:hypothetical protein n=1 Tax=Lewinella sp. IMCC34183 TaxID=2248762 RepID=UPI00130074A0|nr:hypothetical protein [Lewinella sp. IMCC34183]
MMKFLLTAVFAIALFACDDANTTAADVPAAVTDAFNSAYPGATNVEWEMDDDIYEVEFDMNGEEMEAEFSSTGEMLEIDED